MLLVCAVYAVGIVGDAVAVRAPARSEENTATYYYVSNGVKDNGDFPDSYIGFYWKDETGDKTIRYTGRQCNSGGYSDNNNGTVRVSLYSITASGALGSVIRSEQVISDCRNGKTTDLTANLSQTNRDSDTNLKGIVVRVRATGTTRAFFTLTNQTKNSDDTDAWFGALGNRAVGYSRDFHPGQTGFYTIRLSFGALCSTSDRTGQLRFRDVDAGNQYQRENMTFRVRNVETNQWLSNTDSRFLYSSRDDIVRTSNETTFRLTSGSGGSSSIDFNMAANTRYELEVRNISEMNDIAVYVPTNEIDGKISCTNFTAQPGIEMSVDGGTTWLTTSTTVAQGASVVWRHRFNVTGTGNPPTITYGYGDDETTGTGIVVDNRTAWSANLGVGGGDAAWQSSPSYTVPTNTTADTKFCRQTYIEPRSSSNNSQLSSGELCVTVSVPPYTYTLTPVVNVASPTLTPGEPITFTPSVTKNPAGGTTNATTWTLRRFIAPANVNAATLSTLMNTVRTTGTFNCTYYASVAKPGSCADVGSGTTPFTNTSTGVGDDTTNIYPAASTSTLAIGERVCYALYINSSTQTAGQPAEIVNCAIVAKYPALQVQQGMVRAGGAFSNASGACQLAAAASRSSILMHDYNDSTGTRGSRGLAALAIGNIQYFGSSNSAYDASNPVTRNLLFANSTSPAATPAGYQAGLFLGTSPTTTFCLPNATSLYANRAGGATTSVSGTLTVSLATAMTATYNFTGSDATLVLSGDRTLNPGEQVIIRVNNIQNGERNVVRIAGNIRYSSTPTNLAAGQRVPQFVLIADGDISIHIPDTVTELNGIYSTKGTVYTCVSGTTPINGASPITNTTCNQPLTIKGALIATQVLPYRTAGYDNSTNTTPAETFRLTPEALIGDYQYGQDSLFLRTVRQRELPVRL